MINIGANKDASDFVEDYVIGLKRFYEAADAFTINISSPNTPGLRDLQAPDELDKLLKRLMETRTQLMDEDDAPYRPITVKLAPDIDDEACPSSLNDCWNTRSMPSSSPTPPFHALALEIRLTRQRIGRWPLWRSLVRALHQNAGPHVYQITKGSIPLIGVGGVNSGETALAKMQAGATLIELYTGLIYEGPSLITRIKRALVHHCEQNAYNSIAQTIGTKADEWAAKEI